MTDDERRELNEQTARAVGACDFDDGVWYYSGHGDGSMRCDAPNFDSPEIVKALLEDLAADMILTRLHDRWLCFLLGDQAICERGATQFEALARARVAAAAAKS